MDEDKAEKDESGRSRSMNRLGSYWIRGMIYILAVVLVYYAIKPLVGYITPLVNEVGLVLAIALLVIVAPTTAGWLGSKLFAPLFYRWQSAGDLQSWEERLVEELSPGKKRGFPVVLVSWPNEAIRSIGILASRHKSSCGTTELAVIYFPGVPDPTSGGSLRVVSAECIEVTDWSMSNLLSSCVSYGSTGPKMFTDVTPQDE